MRSLTAKVADFIATSDYDEMPQESVSAAKGCLLDGLGCALAGATEQVSSIVTEYVRELGGKPRATVIMGGFKTSPPLAALVNGVMIHALDYDDNCYSLPLHPSAVLLPAVLATGELCHASGKEVIEAYIIGYEIAVRLGRSLQEHYYDGGWHNTATVGSLGAAAASAKILKLSNQQIRFALGIAASEAAGLRKNFGTMTKPFHAGNAAKSGIVAASLAAKGFSSDNGILEGRLGFCTSLGGSEETLMKLMETLGFSYEMASPGVLLKAYPSCFGTHKCIEGMLYLKNKHGFNARDIVEIEVETDAVLPQVLKYHQPKTPLEARFSLEYCAAIAAQDGRVGLEQFSWAKVRDPQVQQLQQRVKYVHTDDAAAQKRQPDYPERVMVKLQDGKLYDHTVQIVKGDPRNPMTETERVSKYLECASLVLPQGNAEKLLSLMSNLEAIDDISKVTNVVLSTGRKSHTKSRTR